MLNNEELQSYAKKKEQGYRKHLGDPIKPLFNNGLFQKNNWNCGSTYGFRKFAFHDLEEGRNPIMQFDEEISEDSSMLVTRNLFWVEDMWYSLIMVVKRTLNSYETYTVASRVYKNRGTIDSIEKDGHPITEKEYVELLKDIALVDYPIWK